MKRSVYALFILWSSISVQAQNWNLVWSDEFDALPINVKNWTFEVGNNNGWGNSELENYTNRSQNATIQNGNLLIIARKESYGGYDYTSARMKTQGKRSWKYGKVEANIKIPVGQGKWPAFWMLGANINTVSWPACGEIDIMEHIDSDNTLYGTIHWDNNGHSQYGGNTTFDVKQYHVFSIEWDSLAIKWKVDGTQYAEANIANNINSTEEFHLPFFILFNFAVGGSWPGNPDGTSVFPDTMSVDYVRVYQQGLTTDLQEADFSPTASSLAVYPNPTKGDATLRYTVGGDASDVSLSLYDAFGNEILPLAKGEQLIGEQRALFPLEQLRSGVYVIKGNIGQRSVFYKIVKQ